MPPIPFSLRVYYEDTDAGGVVYYANYLKFAERARTEALRGAGIDQSALLSESGIAFVVRRASAEFLRPARLDDLLTIDTKIRDIGKVSITMHQTLRRDAEILTEIAVKIGVVGRDFRPARLPEAVREKLLTLASTIHP